MKAGRKAVLLLGLLIAAFGLAAWPFYLFVTEGRGAFPGIKLSYDAVAKGFVDWWNPVAWTIGLSGFREYPFMTPAVAIMVAFSWLPLGALGAASMILLKRQLAAGREQRAQAATSHGSAAWATARQMAAFKGEGRGLVLGRDKSLIYYRGNQHLVVIGPTRSGKGQGFLIPNLLSDATAKSSIFMIDVKGENAQATQAHRAKCGGVHILDPFGLVTKTSASFNALAGMEPTDPLLVSKVEALAAALLPDEAVGDPHWTIEGRALLATYMLHVVTTELPEHRHLVRVYDLLTLNPGEVEKLQAEMQGNDAADGVIRRGINRFLAKTDREASGVYSNATKALGWLDNPPLRAVSGSSSFSFEELTDWTTTIYLVIPPKYLVPYAAWQRLLVARALEAFAERTSQVPVLFLLDEFAQLGRLQKVEEAFGLMAGYGVQLAVVVQNLSQLEKTYGRGAHTFLANAGATLVMGCPDLPTAKMVSDALGKTTITLTTENTGTSASGGLFSPSTRSSGTSTQYHGRELLTADELRTLDSDVCIALLQNHPPLWLAKVKAWRDPEFSAKYQQEHST
jgi:type IV secretion system protein VirD4